LSPSEGQVGLLLDLNCRTVSEMTSNVSSRTLNLSHSLYQLSLWLASKCIFFRATVSQNPYSLQCSPDTLAEFRGKKTETVGLSECERKMEKWGKKGEGGTRAVAPRDQGDRRP